MTWFSVIFVVAFAFYANLAITTGNPIQPTNDNFNVFLINTLEKYPAWIQDNNLDPSPPGNFTANLRINKEDFQLICTITDEQIVGYQNQSNLFEITQVVDLDLFQWLLLGFEYKGVVSFQGTYNASGTIGNTNVSLNGNGSWIYTSNKGIRESLNIIYDINDAGYVTVWDEYWLHGVGPLDESDDEIHFEGLLDDGAGGFAEEIRESLRAAYVNRIGDSETRQPTRQLVLQYLSEIFKETSYEDIIAGKQST